MHFKQFYVGCLAHASYLIGDQSQAAVVDPSRDIDMYIDEAKAHGLVIRWVIETHLHADFVSGHRELAARTGATIAIGVAADAEFIHRPLRDGDEIRLGRVKLRVMETPGHTPESLSILVYEHDDEATPWGVLTGDTLFVGDVGRVDILSTRLSVTDLAGKLYDSVGKLMTLPDETRVYPAHGAGSLCGRSIGKDTWSTIGRERIGNPALRTMTREEFVAEVTRDVPETPVYFLHSRDLNRSGPGVRAGRPMPPWLVPEAFAAAAKDAIVLDTRANADYAAEHIPGSLHVSLDGQYASWVGTLVAPEQRLLLVVDSERAEEAVMRLARVGYEQIAGMLEGGIARWRGEGRAVAASAEEPITTAVRPGRRVLDVRRPREWEAFHLEGALHVPLSQLPQWTEDLDADADWVVVCASGYRSSIAVSLLERAGLKRVTNATGGMDAWRNAGLPASAED